MPACAFISSLATEHSDLRLELHNTFGDRVWVAEYTRPDLSIEVSDLAIVDACAESIERSDYFVCIFAGRRGSPIQVGPCLANATHFETELFQAALMGKEFHVFVAKGYEPDPSLQGLLDILKQSVPPKNWLERLSDEDIKKAVGKLVGRSIRRYPRKVLSRLRTNLFDLRGRYLKKEGILTEFFAGDRLVDYAAAPRIDLVEEIIRSLDEESDHHKKLSRIYIGLRDLFTRPLEDTELLPLRNQLLVHWVTAASWYGLHGHIRSGALAAAQSMVLVRERMKSERVNINDDHMLVYPGVQMASTLYSIGRHLNGSRKADILTQAHQHIERALSESSFGKDNLLAIRGSLYRIGGAIDLAMQDYKQVLQFREKNDASTGKIGDAMAELGFGYLRQGKLKRGNDFIERGVALMRQDATSGFLVRGLKKLSVAQLATGQLIAATRSYKEARALAREAKMFDQAR